MMNEKMSGAEEVANLVSNRSATIGEMIDRLDRIGFSVADTRFSLWTGLVVLLVLIGIFVCARIGTKLAHRILSRLTALTPTQSILAEKLLQIVIWALAFFIGIDLLGVDLTTLAIFSGAFGLAIGFGLQKTFGNLIAGIILLLDRSIKPGDVITVSDMNGRERFGQIRKIGIRAISVVTRDKKEYLIPNENLMINQVENWSYSSRDVRIRVPVGVAHDADIELAEALMLQAAHETPRVLETPETRVLLIGFGERTIDFEIRFWIIDPEEGIGSVRSEVLKRVWHLFHEHGVGLPFPQRDINLRDTAQFRQLVAAIGQRGEKAPDEGG